MYAGALFLIFSIPWLLGSWYGLALAMIVGFSFRAVLEERTLSAQFPDYADDAARVRYRLVPFLWQVSGGTLPSPSASS
jgi:protein-S-isoprenylcysteine O-methyltransferase Ste14